MWSLWVSHEHPFDGSWGYQVTGLFTHRLPVTEHRRISNIWWIILHRQKIGIILDWVSGTFFRRMHTDWLTLTELLYMSMQIRDRVSIRTGEPRSTITDVRR